MTAELLLKAPNTEVRLVATRYTVALRHASTHTVIKLTNDCLSQEGRLRNKAKVIFATP